MLDMVCCSDPAGVLTYVSPASQGLLGYGPEELVGAPANFFHPDDFARITDALAGHVSQGPGAAPLRLEFRVLRKDGASVWVESGLRAVYDPQSGDLVGFQDSLRDISERRATEARLARSEMRFRLMAENANDIIACYDPDTRFTFLSPSVRTLLGYDPEELTGQTAISVMHPGDVRRVVKAFRDHIAGGPKATAFRIEYRALHKDGSVVWLETRPRAIYDPVTSDLIEFQDVARDVTERKAMEAELAAAREEAESASAVKSAFLANMSHEIRTPLTAILGFAGLLTERQDLNATARQHLDRITSGSRALLAIVNDILDFSKLEAEQVEFRPRSVALRPLVEDSLAMFIPEAAGKGVTLGFEMDGPVPDHVMVDSDRLRQILLNLIGNAVKFTEIGSVTVRLAYMGPLGQLRVEVSDTGVGMDEGQRAHLFKRFSQVDGSSTRKYGGTGLGLAICKGLAEAMGGSVGVRSAVGLGSTFHVTIAAPVARAADKVTEGPSLGDIEGLRLLIVDDNSSNRDLARAVLEPMGVEVTDVESGYAALVEAEAMPYDVILLDIRMPGLSGPETLERLRSRPGPNQHIPILAFSADADLADGSLGGGFDDLILKPISPRDLIIAMVKWAPGGEQADQSWLRHAQA
ncbi:MAG: hybrid sensor histidine kinase/response regulator [Alphaproteobacteria bacterium PA2]|nr:MAG: hybrid sensor histidine kinase/response regulator [Alphaproteobacteria bacterium PA2]